MCGWPGVVSLLMHPQGAPAHLQREVMIEVDHSAPEAEVTGRQPDVEAIRQEIEPVAEASGRSMRRSCNGQGSSQSPGTIT